MNRGVASSKYKPFVLRQCRSPDVVLKGCAGITSPSPEPGKNLMGAEMQRLESLSHQSEKVEEVGLMREANLAASFVPVHGQACQSHGGSTRIMQSTDNRPIRISTVIVITTLALSLVASAAGAGDFDRPGVYLSVSGLYAVPLFEDELQKITPALSIDDTAGLQARLGFRLLSFLAVEAQYEWIDGFDVDFDGQGTIMSLASHNLTGNLRLHIPIWRIEPYALAGLGATFWKINDENDSFLFPDGDSDGTGFAGRLGGGVDFYLTEHIVLNAEATAVLTTKTFEVPNAVQSIDNVFYVAASAGLTYRF
jgi:opacity protein-like surface antigen